MAKAPLTDAEKAALRTDTHDAAIALAQDVMYTSGLVGDKYPTSGDIRRLSAIMRRILNEDLHKIAGPRLGRIQLKAPDLKPFQKQEFVFAYIDDAHIFGMQIAEASIVEAGPKKATAPYEHTHILVSSDTFLKQKVITLGGHWATRGDVIRYVANLGSGVHSGVTKKLEDRLLEATRSQATLRMQDGKPLVHIHLTSSEADKRPLTMDEGAIDIVLLALFTTAKHFVESPDVQRLVDYINENE